MFNLFRLIKYYLFKKKGLFYPTLASDFYVFHQNKFRGFYEEIKKRQSVYLKFLETIPQSARRNSYFLDIGFGRGEFINLLKKNKFKNVEGVDINKDYVLASKKKGYNVYYGDGLKHLYLSEKKYYGISAFHLIEHLEFHELFDLLLISSKKLVEGGILILETPNVENVSVGSFSFYLDPTHKLKLPSLLLKTLLEYLGFKKIEFLYLQPNKQGAQDLGIVAYK